jgi:predicted nucleic acid-binding protein
MSFLLDTNVISELRKGNRCDANVRAWISAVDDQELLLSALTIGEIRRGIESIRRRDTQSANALEGWLRQVTTEYQDRIIGIDQEIAEEWGRSDVPDPMPVIDGLLAATAKVHRLTLVTRNVKDIKRAGVSYLDPFATHKTKP